MQESNDIKELWEWLLQFAGRLSTNVILENDQHGYLLKFTSPVDGNRVLIRKFYEGHALRWSFAGNIAPKRLLSELKQSLTDLPHFDSYQFYQHTIAFCEMKPVYLDQLLARLEFCEECCSYAINTVTWELYNLLRYRIQERLNEILPKQLAA